MTAQIVILGAGASGTRLANRLNRLLPSDEATITVVDRDDRHLYQPGLLFVPFGQHKPDRLVRSRAAQLRSDVRFRTSRIEHVGIRARQVSLSDGSKVPYDVLVVATGAEQRPEHTPGLIGPGWLERVFSFYTLPAARALAGALNRFRTGHIVVNVVDMPITCPVAPLEFCFLLDDYLRRHHRRADIDITYATPLDAAFTNPHAAATLSGLLARKGINLVTGFRTAEVYGADGRLVGLDGRQLSFDLGVVAPLHRGASYIGRTPGLGDALGFVPTDPATLQSPAAPEIFAIGDATDLLAAQPGSGSYVQGETVAENIRRHLAGEPLIVGCERRAPSVVETGGHQAMLLDLTEPDAGVPSRNTSPAGRLLATESRFNHLTKLAFEHLYWHALLPGRTLPEFNAAVSPIGGLSAAG